MEDGGWSFVRGGMSLAERLFFRSGRGVMNPGDEYLAERERRRGALQTRITYAVEAFFGTHLAGWMMISCTGATLHSPVGFAFSLVGVAFLIASLTYSVCAVVLTLRHAMLLSWRWLLSGCLPWGMICFESAIFLMAMTS